MDSPPPLRIVLRIASPQSRQKLPRARKVSIVIWLSQKCQSLYWFPDSSVVRLCVFRSLTCSGVPVYLRQASEAASLRLFGARICILTFFGGLFRQLLFLYLPCLAYFQSHFQLSSGKGEYLDSGLQKEVGGGQYGDEQSQVAH